MSPVHFSFQLTQAHMARVSRRIIRVVSELVFQLLVPALMVRLQTQDISEASASKSSKQQCHSEGETQSEDSRLESPPLVQIHLIPKVSLYV